MKRESIDFIPAEFISLLYRIMVTTDKYNRAKEELNKVKREMASSPAGMLYIEKVNLEATLKQLSEEVRE